MNILIIVNKSELMISKVMLTSLLKNNKGLSIVCGFHGLQTNEVKSIESLVNYFESKISFFQLSDLEDISAKDKFILDSYYFFEEEKERALFISNDNVINDDISEFYNQEFKEKLLIARGQTYNFIPGFREGARPERSQHFDSRILLLNLDLLSRIDSDDLISKGKKSFGEFKSFAASINCIFYEKTKIIYDFKYNVRHSIYFNEEITEEDFKVRPVIISYEKRDYYGIGLKHTPWEYCLEEKEFISNIDEGYLILEYGRKKAYDINIKITSIWNNYFEEYKKIEGEESSSIEKISGKIEELYKENQRVNRLSKRIINKHETDNLTAENIEYSFVSRMMNGLSPKEAINFISEIHSECNKLKKLEKKLKVGFVVNSSSEWQCEMLYRRMENSKEFEPKIIVGYQIQGSPEVYFSLREKTYKFFCEKYDVVSNEDIKKVIDEFDLLIYISPYDMYPECLKVENRNINQVIVHIPYSYYLVSKDDAIYTEPFYERTIFQIAWLVCASNSAEVEIAKEHQRLNAYNFEVTGFPKMDEFITKSYSKREFLVENDNKTIIIWAPHFNMLKGMNGTFQYNYRWFLEYAQNHKDVYWIIRPHPRFASGAIEAGVFLNAEEVDLYFDKWGNLSNAIVIDGGGYFDIFESSSAMILDSISFLAEYQFTGKPILFLSPREPRGMNKLGKEILDVIYRAGGDEFNKIEEFIDNVKKGHDPLKETRMFLFDKRLNYQALNSSLAVDYIWEKLKNLASE